MSDCGHAGHVDVIAVINRMARLNDPEITLYTPKETIRLILVGRFKARLEHRNASSLDEKIRTVTVPGQTLEREERLRSNLASIRDRNCCRQIKKIGSGRI